MTLLDQCKEVEKKISDLEYLSKNHAEARDLKMLEESLSSFNKRIDILLKFKDIFNDQGEKLEAMPNSSDAIDLVIRLYEKFKEKPSRATLVQRNQWTRLETVISSIIDNSMSSVRLSWGQYCRSNYAGESPEQLEESIGQSDVNKTLLSKFRSEYNNFRELLNSLPENSQHFETVKNVASKLQNISSQIDRNIPDAVRKFFAGVNQPGGASLDLLTDEVLEWLKQQESFRTFKVIRKS